jgi:hypothetical protein
MKPVSPTRAAKLDGSAFAAAGCCAANIPTGTLSPKHKIAIRAVNVCNEISPDTLFGRPTLELVVRPMWPTRLIGVSLIGLPFRLPLL